MVYIFSARALAPCRCCPLSSNVRPHNRHHLHGTMSIEIYGSRFSHGQSVGIRVEVLSQAFAGLVARIEPEAFMLDLGPCGEVQTPLYLQAHEEETTSFSVARPVDDPRLYKALLQVLQHEGVVLYAPGSPPVLGHPKSAGHLPEDMADALGAGVVVSSASALQSALFNGQHHSAA
jgi:hypothetical protein